MSHPLEFTLNRAQPEALVDQIVREVGRAMQRQTLHAGMRMPSIRSLAKAHQISTFTVVEAYDRLVAQGVLVARRGAGFFVAGAPDGHAAAGMPGSPGGPAVPSAAASEVTNAWLLSEIFADDSIAVKSGCGWLPDSWLDEDGLHGALRQLAKGTSARFAHYGHPNGYGPLRQWIARRLAELAIDAPPERIVLTQGATQALDLVVRTLLQPGDTVLVEAPAYCNLLAILRLAGLNVVGVPRTEAGLDLAALDQAAAAHRPRALFLNPALHNPLGTSLSPAGAHRILQAAEQHGFWVVEDDIYRELAPAGTPSLAAMDGLSRVIYISSFSKTISPSVRVGYLACGQELVREIARSKMVAGLTSSEINERIVHAVLTEGRHRKHIERLTDRLTRARGRLTSQLQSHGLTLLAQPEGGMFVCASLPEGATPARELAEQALAQSIMLAPGEFFLANAQPCRWFRFNVAYSDDPRLFRFLEAAARV
ncbi:GntR family transcriptional regulator [Pandoraea terrae]|uniref:GntR family transcriptional regulator n=1 Tax=Pandoraea terrae TaxID=1537710 RepID=A0A5E4UW70_9BURK|nr:PLP-dependent aminotransferase family protein [Pandoraea terrae]VVE04218.1 GntR family transcriptional regulator [Pandoraea terrae]